MEGVCKPGGEVVAEIGGGMADELRFTKMEGVGNDFVVVDGRADPAADWSTLALELCDRHTGIGADGLLVLESTHLADIRMRMFNPDGTPDVCGNGLRCIARYAIERGIVQSDTLRIATLAGGRGATARRGADGVIEAVTVAMGQPRFEPADIPMRVPRARVVDYPLELDDGVTLPISALSTGTAHAIAFVNSLPDDATFLALSPQVECHPLFPDRTSLMWCKVEGPQRLRLRIWERGAGETWGCGTGACAVAVAAIEKGFATPGEPVIVASRGGELRITWQPHAEIEMTGPAETVFDGIYRLYRTTA
ncbi:MAG TPA: diaminopimelate epimerase [Chthonomonadaceae bacterium]|nr:diaminopimelate epimerase [Chthonomonadaceae bacterium]